MALNLRERFARRDALTQLSLASDFRFVPSEYASLRDHRVEHDDIDVLEHPLTIDRLYFLVRGSDSLQLEFALSLEGASGASELLFRRAEAFQREPASEAVQDLVLAHGIGDLGLTWSWGKEDRNGVVGFVRHNVLVFLQGRNETLIEQAREIDIALSRANARPSAPQIDEPSFEFGTGEALRVKRGERIDLGTPIKPGDRHFFISSGGSVNRDPKDPARHYFRAGLLEGQHRVTVLRVGAGLLPARQTIRITIE